MYRVMSAPYPGMWTFDHHPWLKDMHDSKCVSNRVQKSAQMGVSELALNLTFYFLDVKKMDVLYVLPNKNPDASEFTAARFNKALDLSPHLESMFSDTNNIGHKRAGYASLFIHGSNSRKQLKSMPVSLIVLDELDEMTQEHIPLAIERSSGQLERYDWQISTPTVDNFGINAAFANSTQEHFQFPCPSCGKWIELKYPESIVIVGEDENDPRAVETHLICYECKNILPHEGKHEFLNRGKWEAMFPGNVNRGFYINQMYSMHLHPEVIARKYFEAQRDIASDQEFYNSKLGLPRIVADARLTLERVNTAVANGYKMYDSHPATKLITMGVDVGKMLHVSIDSWEVQGRQGNDVSSYSRRKNILHVEVKDFEQLDNFMVNYNVAFAVVDAMPETRKSFEFVSRWYGRARMCRYVRGLLGRQMGQPDDNPESTVNVDRTGWLDLLYGRFKNNTIALPIDTQQRCKDQLMAPIRVLKLDKNGDYVATYQTPVNMADHYAHAMNYSEIALPLALGIAPSKDIKREY